MTNKSIKLIFFAVVSLLIFLSVHIAIAASKPGAPFGEEI